MSQAIKRGLPYNILFGEEAVAYGTKAAAMGAFPEKLTSFDEIIAQEEMLATLLASQNEAEDAFYGVEAAGWGGEFELVEGAILAFIMGTDTISGTDPYTHDLSLNNDTPPVSIETIPEDMPESRDFLGGKFNEIALQAATNEIVTGSFAGISRMPAKNASPGTPVEPTKDPFIFHQAALLVGATQHEDVARSFEFKCNRGIVGITGLGSKQFVDIKEGRRNADLTLEIYPDSNELLDIILGGVDIVGQVVLTRGASDTITLDFPKMKPFSLEPAIGEEAYIETLPLRVIGDWTAEIVNDVTPAYV